MGGKAPKERIYIISAAREGARCQFFFPSSARRASTIWVGIAVTLHHPGRASPNAISYVENITRGCVCVCVFTCARVGAVLSTRVTARALRALSPVSAAVIIRRRDLKRACRILPLPPGRADKNFHANCRAATPSSPSPRDLRVLARLAPPPPFSIRYGERRAAV